MLPYKDPDKQREYQRNWAKRKRATFQKYQRKLRKQVLELLGGKCIRCGCIEPKALEINHTNCDGAKERKNNPSNKQFHLDIVKGRRDIDDLELTCKVCNAAHYLEFLGYGRYEIKYTIMM